MVKHVNLFDWLPLPWDDNEPIWTDPESAHYVTDVYTQGDYELEGKLLAHCLGTKDANEWNKTHRMFSVRSPEGIPHATILATLAPQLSPYGMARDLGTAHPMVLFDELVFVLQVRGRGDALAHLVYHQIARRWYEAHGGKLDGKAHKRLNNACEAQGDNDAAYHFEFMWDPWPFQRFNFLHTNAERVAIARLNGSSR